MELKDRLKLSRKNAGFTQIQVSEAVKMTQATYSQLERGIVKSTSKIVEIAQILNVNPNWLATGEGEMSLSVIDKEKYALGNVEAVPNSKLSVRYAPVLNYVQAGKFTDIGDNDYDEYLPYTDDKISDNAYWLIVKGDSMTPDFQEGDYLLIDAKRQAQSGDYVIAMMSDDNEATFKRYKHCGFDEKLNREYCQLVALNDFYSPIDSRHTHFSVIGVVMEHKRKLKK
ncbi:XRE family transcriptional regulator [Moraxella sp. VT-16-12]|uniref:LexA family transcriptional regulator n=1 Tax=Moraxella sp. VT-16-12 TaxID=2014877 RepID=UPI000B7E82E8|nr:XRE family transcriptional regulator [Moraxella sp. VT-16-12]TWV81531.1 helix-turn-helix domain-containing protein [Moraxella sp. VT-16-12]